MRYLVTALLLAAPLPLFAGKNTVATGQTVFVPPLTSQHSTFVPPLPLLQSGATESATASQQALSDAVAERVASQFTQATAFCSNIAQKEYTVDCFAYEYWEISETLSDTGAEGEVKKVIQDTARKLEQVVRQNRTNALPPARARRTGNAPKTTTRRLNPVAPAAVSDAARQAATVIAEAQTILLRSSENSERRRAQFQKVVASMESGTILLRSL